MPDTLENPVRQKITKSIPPQRESTMSGKDLLTVLLKSGTGWSKLSVGMRVVETNHNATANDVYAAIEAAGWHTQIRPVLGYKEGTLSRENRFEATLRKARWFMEGRSLEWVKDTLEAESRRNSGGVVITEDEIAAAGTTPRAVAEQLAAMGS